MRQSEVSFTFADQAIVTHPALPPSHPGHFFLVLSTAVDVFDCATVVVSDKFVEEVNIVSVDSFGF